MVRVNVLQRHQKRLRCPCGVLVGTSYSPRETLIKTGAQKDQNMAHSLAWLLLTWIIWPVNRRSPLFSLKALFEIAARSWSNVKLTEWQCLCQERKRLAKVRLQTANSTLAASDEQWGLCWDPHENQSCPDALSARLLHILSYQKKQECFEHNTDHWFENNIATCRITWSKVTLESALIWSSLSIYHENYFQVWKVFTASEIQALSWDRMRPDTHFYHIKYALGNKLGRRPGVIC